MYENYLQENILLYLIRVTDEHIQIRYYRFRQQKLHIPFFIAENINFYYVYFPFD